MFQSLISFPSFLVEKSVLWEQELDVIILIRAFNVFSLLIVLVCVCFYYCSGGEGGETQPGAVL